MLLCWQASPRQPACRLVRGDRWPPAPAAAADGSYALSPGMHNLKIQRTGYLTFVLFCEIQLGAETRPKIVFLEDSAFVQAKKNAGGSSDPPHGGLLTVGGFIFNIDDVAIALSSDYQGYKLWKYLGLASWEEAPRPLYPASAS